MINNAGSQRYLGSVIKSSTIFSPERIFSLSRRDLTEMLRKEPLRTLTSILFPQKPSLPRSLRKVVEQSAIILADALHLASPSARLLGAVMSIEILISNQGDSYDTIRKRLTGLLGNDAEQRYNAEAVLKARHSYVHKGEEIRSDILPLKAIALALSCLLRYAEITPRFKNKDTLLNYLDF